MGPGGARNADQASGGTYEVLEGGNGESAWQVLMLDHQLFLVIAGGHLPKLEALNC